MVDSSEISLSFKLTYSELLRAMLYNWMKSFRYLRYLIYGCVSIGAALSGLFEEPLPVFLGFVGVAYVVSPLWWCPYTVWRQVRAARNIGPAQLEVIDNRLRVRNEDESSESFIGEFEKVYESRQSILLYIDSSFYLVVPRRVFENEEEAQRFTEFAYNLVKK